MLRACLLGDFRLERDGDPVELPRAEKARELLAYLLVCQNQNYPRLPLAAMFWPDTPEDRARHSLSHALWQLRQMLPDLIAGDNDALWIAEDAALWIDAVEFGHLTAPHLGACAEPCRASHFPNLSRCQSEFEKRPQ